MYTTCHSCDRFPRASQPGGEVNSGSFFHEQNWLAKFTPNVLNLQHLSTFLQNQYLHQKASRKARRYWQLSRLQYTLACRQCADSSLQSTKRDPNRGHRICVVFIHHNGLYIFFSHT